MEKDIKLGHFISLFIGAQLAARLMYALGREVRAHWLRSARECGYTYAWLRK